jgi:ABC-type molybdenum transport system ATPase subunit/photorepair protein PhrA
MTEKIMMARCIVNQPNLFLLDDQQRIASGGKENDYLKDLLIDKKAPWTLIAATKHEQWLPYFEQIVKLDKGKIAFIGSFDEYKNWKNNA